MVTHSQTICRLLPTNCLNVFDNFVRLALKGLKKRPLAKLTEIKETLCLCDIWRIRNPKLEALLLARTTLQVLLNKDMNFSLVSQTSQEFVKNSDVLASICTNHSPIDFSLE